MPYPTAILFDLDDTILDSTLSSDRLWSAAAAEFAPKVGVDASVFDQQMQASRLWFWEDVHRNAEGRLDLEKARTWCVEHALNALNLSNPDLAQEIADWFTARRITSMQPFDGAIHTLQTLKDAGVRMALISNGKGETQRAKVVQFNLEPYFDCIILEGEFGAGKPDRRVFDHALQSLNAQPNETWMVGDNLRWEVDTPQKLGMKGVWVDWKRTGLPPDTDITPDRIVHTIAELLA